MDVRAIGEIIWPLAMAQYGIQMSIYHLLGDSTRYSSNHCLFMIGVVQLNVSVDESELRLEETCNALHFTSQ
jgi:hypothetical protein